MVVQPAINPKKASGQYGTRRATIGKGVSTLDDFDDFSEYDQFLEQGIANVISSSSPPSSLSSGASYNNPYSSGLVNTLGHHLTSDFNSPINTRNESASSVDNSSRINLDGNNLANLVNSVPGYSNTSNSLVNNNNGSHNSQVLLIGSNNLRAGSTSVWNSDTVPTSHNNALAQGNISQSNNTTTTLINLTNGNTIHQPMITEQFLLKNREPPVNQAASVLGVSQGIDPAIVNKIAALTHQMNQLQVALNANPSNIHIVTAIQKVQQELILSQSQQSLQGQVAKEQAKIQQDSMQRHMLQQQQQLQQEQQMQQRVLSLGSVIGVGNQLQQPQLSNMNNLTSCAPNVNSSGPTIKNSNTISSTANNNYNNGSMSVASNSRNLNNNGSVNTSVCLLCNEPFDSGARLPKILGCTHTFCLRCLHLVAAPNMELQCPSRCGVSTQLSAAGVAGLTTNQGILSTVTNVMQFNNNFLQTVDHMNNANQVNIEEVCASCAGNLDQDQSLTVCKELGHTLVRAQDAMQLIVSKLKPLIQDTIVMLREAMTLRSEIKDRADCTLASLCKFMEELKVKRQRDNSEDTMLVGTFTELSRVVDRLDIQSYADLVKTYHMVDKCCKDVKLQYNQCLTATCLNEAVKAVMIEIQPNSLGNISKLGLKRDEIFDMDRSLQSHATDGNYANVLMQYMVSDLLSSRVTCKNSFSAADSIVMNTELVTSEGNDPRSASSVSPPSTANSDAIMDMANGPVYRSLAGSSSATPDMTAMNGHNTMDTMGNNLDNLDISCVIQTTEAIEAESRALSNPDITPYSEHSTSLGLSNICHMANNDDIIETVDLEKSLLEGSACIEPEPTKIESSAPSPNSSNSITPPIVGNAARASVDSSAASSDSGIVSCSKPFSYLDAAKKPAKPQPDPAPKSEVPKISMQVKQVKTPHCWMKISVDGKSIGRIVFQLRPDKAPKMCENFLGLCTGKPGYGYQGTHFFKNGDGFLAGGDVEYDDGSGGYSIFSKKKFEADLCPLKDEVGMIRFKGNGTSEAGRGMVGSQFMVWYAEREFKKFSYSLVFGRVVDGLEVVKKAANVNLSKHDVMIEESGGIM